MRLFLGVLAVLLNSIGYYPYVRDILRGKVKPQRMTWGIWTILASIIAVNQIVNEGGWSSLFFVSTSILVLTTFLLSLKYGIGGFEKLDIICCIFAFALFIYWATQKDTRISTLIAVNIDLIAVIPTIIKTFKLPDTESYPQWMLAGIGGLLSLLAVPKLDWVLLIYPAYIFVANYIIVGTKYFRERKILS